MLCVCVSHNNRLSHHINLIHTNHTANCEQKHSVFKFSLTLYHTSRHANGVANSMWICVCVYQWIPMQCNAFNARIFSVRIYFLCDFLRTHAHTVTVTSTVGTIISIMHKCSRRVCVDEYNLVIKMKIDTRIHTQYGSHITELK